MRVALIGYGEVGRILAEDLRAAGHAVDAHDLQLASGSGQAMQAHARQHGTRLADSHVAAVRDAELVISAVTASHAGRTGARHRHRLAGRLARRRGA